MYLYPQKTIIDRFLPKSRILQHSQASAAVRELFTLQVKSIRWHAVLTSESTNLASTPAVEEIDIFRIILKGDSLDARVLQCIDKAIPRPIFFELHQDSSYQCAAAYKRPSETDTTKQVVSEIFYTASTPLDSERQPLPIALDLETLYTQMLASVLPLPLRRQETAVDHVARVMQHNKGHKELTRLEIRLRKEKQFNRKVELNQQIRMLRKSIQHLA